MARTFSWAYKGKVHRSTVLVEPCPVCGARAVVALPLRIAAEQPDGTTHVCHPLVGGCNHGFSVDAARLSNPVESS